MRVGDSVIVPTQSLRDLGVYFQSTGEMSVNINQICKSAYFALHRISKIRALLDQSSTKKLVHAFVSSRLDYCNSILYGSTSHELQ